MPSSDETDQKRPTTQTVRPWDDELARKWANSQRTQKGRQKPKPIGDNEMWHRRALHLPKTVRNVRRSFRYEFKRALDEVDELTAESAHDVVDMANSKLMTWYRRLYYLDVFHIIIRGKPGGPEELFYMNEEQIRRNDEERECEGPPGSRHGTMAYYKV